MDPSAAHMRQFAVPAHSSGDAQKRLLSTPPQEPEHLKRHRMDPSMPAAGEATPIDPRVHPPGGAGGPVGSHVTAGSGHGAATTHVAAVPPISSAAAGTSTQAAGPSANQEVSPSDLPVVEAMVRREGTDKFKRFPFDPTMNAEQRAERVQDEKKKICPKSALDKALVGLGASETFQCDDTVVPSLCLLAEHMLEQTIEFGALMASRRQSKWMEAKDMELYLDRVWQIPLPAFGHRGISAAPKYNADSTDAKYRSAVRAALSALQPKDAQKKPDDKGTSTPPGRPEDGARSQNE